MSARLLRQDQPYVLLANDACCKHAQSPPSSSYSHAEELVVPFGLLVDDGVNADGGLPGLAVADNKLALATPDGDQSVYSLEAGLT